MYNVSNVTKIKEAYNKAWQDENRNLKLTMTLNGTQLNLANVLDCITWEWDGCSTGYGVGNIFYSMVTFSLYKDVFVQEMMEVAFVISIEITVDGVKQWLDIPFGKYVVTNVEKTKIQSKVTCYDKFYNALKFLFVPNKSDKQYTSTELIKEISGTLNMPIHNVPTYNLANEDIVITNEDGTTTTQKGTNFDGWTYAEMLGLVAGACGGNFFFDRNGEMRFQKGLVPSDVVLTEKQFTEPNMKVNIYSKTGIKITKRNDMEKVVVGETLAEGNPKLYIIENPLFTDETANNLLTILSNISYQPIATSCIGVMPLHLYPLDTITINYEGKDYIVPLMKLMYKFAGGVSGSFESYVETITEATKFSGGGLNGKIDTIQGSVAQMELLVATTVVASNVNASNIEALQVKTEQLQTNYAEINNLVSGNLTAQNMQTGSITSDRLNIADGFITNAMINSVDAGKVRTGSIDTSLVTIQSENGNLVLSDNTIQISDGTNVRVQIGETASGDYALVIWDATGKLMWSATGLTEDAIKTQIIRDDMIKDDANISAEKLNIESLFTALNEDGSNTLKASKILLDTENQTLEVAFNNMTTKQGELEEQTNGLVEKTDGLQEQANGLVEKTEVLTTELNVQSGKIETLIQNTTIIEDGQTINLKDKVSSIEQDLDGITLQVGTVESNITNITDNVTSLEERLARLEALLLGE